MASAQGSTGPQWPPSYETMLAVVEQAATIGCQCKRVFSATIASILQQRGYQGVMNERVVHVGIGDEIVRMEHRGPDEQILDTIDLGVDVCIEHEPKRCIVIEVTTDQFVKRGAVKQALTKWRHLEVQGTFVEKAFVVTFIRPDHNAIFDFYPRKNALADLGKQRVAMEEIERIDVLCDKLTKVWRPTEIENKLFRSKLKSVAKDVAHIGHPLSDKPFAICIASLLHHRFGYSVELEQAIPVQLNGSEVNDTEGNTQYMKTDMYLLVNKGSDSAHTLIRVVYGQHVTQLQVKRALSCLQQLSKQGKEVSKIYFVHFEVDDLNEIFKGRNSKRSLRSPHFLWSTPKVHELSEAFAEDLVAQAAETYKDLRGDD